MKTTTQNSDNMHHQSSNAKKREKLEELLWNTTIDIFIGGRRKWEDPQDHQNRSRAEIYLYNQYLKDR